MSVTATKWQDVKDLHTGVQYTLGPNMRTDISLIPSGSDFYLHGTSSQLKCCEIVIALSISAVGTD